MLGLHAPGATTPTAERPWMALTKPGRMARATAISIQCARILLHTAWCGLSHKHNQLHARHATTRTHSTATLGTRAAETRRTKRAGETRTNTRHMPWTPCTRLLHNANALQQQLCPLHLPLLLQLQMLCSSPVYWRHSKPRPECMQSSPSNGRPNGLQTISHELPTNLPQVRERRDRG